MLDAITTDNQYNFSFAEWNIISNNAKCLDLQKDSYDPNDVVLLINKLTSDGQRQLVNVVSIDELEHALEISNIMNRNIN